MSEITRVMQIQEEYLEKYGRIYTGELSDLCLPFPCKEYLLNPLLSEVDKLSSENGLQFGQVIDFGAGNGRTLQVLCEHFQVPGLGLEIQQPAIDSARGFGSYLADNHGYKQPVVFERCNIVPNALIGRTKVTAQEFIQSQMPCPNITEIESDLFYDPNTLLYLYGYSNYLFVVMSYLLTKMGQQQMLMVPGINFDPYGYNEQLEPIRQEAEFDFYDNIGGTLLIKR